MSMHANAPCLRQVLLYGQENVSVYPRERTHPVTWQWGWRGAGNIGELWERCQYLRAKKTDFYWVYPCYSHSHDTLWELWARHWTCVCWCLFFSEMNTWEHNLSHLNRVIWSPLPSASVGSMTWKSCAGSQTVACLATSFAPLLLTVKWSEAYQYFQGNKVWRSSLTVLGHDFSTESVLSDLPSFDRRWKHWYHFWFTLDMRVLQRLI